MPFTPAHPAILLPFIRARHVSATALVIGSMAPDFEYFFKMSVDGHHGHTLWGVFYFDLPVTIALAFVFHLVVKRNLIQNLPLYFQARFQDTLQLDFVKYFRDHLLVVSLSAVAGTASHLLWDAFTHNDGFFARRLPFYDDTFVPFEGINYPLFYALQTISTFVGLTIMAFYCFFRSPEQVSHYRRPHLLYWFGLIVVTALATWIRFEVVPYDNRIGNFVVTVVSGFLLGLVICGLITFDRKTNTA